MRSAAAGPDDLPKAVDTFRRYCRIVCLFFGIAGGLGAVGWVAVRAITGRAAAGPWLYWVLLVVYASLAALHGVAAFPRRGRRWRRVALAAQLSGLTNVLTLIPSVWFLWRFRKADVRDWSSGEPAAAPPRRA